jgi:hypothetical protein
VGAVLETAAKPLSYTRVLVAAAGDDPAAKPLWGVTVHQRTAAIETDDLPVAAETFELSFNGF